MYENLARGKGKKRSHLFAEKQQGIRDKSIELEQRPICDISAGLPFKAEGKTLQGASQGGEAAHDLGIRQ